MATPQYTAEGVKVAGTGFDYRCGHCGASVARTQGLRDGTVCPSCGIAQRADWGLDLLSERLDHLANELRRAGYRHDSLTMLDAADEIRSMVRSAVDLEKWERLALGAINVDIAEPVGASIVPSFHGAP